MNVINKLSSDFQPGNLDRLRTACVQCYDGVLRRLARMKVKIEREFAQEMAGY